MVWSRMRSSRCISVTTQSAFTFAPPPPPSSLFSSFPLLRSRRCLFSCEERDKEGVPGGARWLREVLSLGLSLVGFFGDFGDNLGVQCRGVVGESEGEGEGEGVDEGEGEGEGEELESERFGEGCFVRT